MKSPLVENNRHLMSVRRHCVSVACVSSFCGDHAELRHESQERVLAELAELRRAQTQRNQWLALGVSLLAAIVLMLGWAFLGFRLPRL